MDLLKEAKELGAVLYSGGVCLPAETLTRFLNTVASNGQKIRYIECLFFYEPYGAAPNGTEPHLDLSRDFIPGQSTGEFVAKADQLAHLAVKRAAGRGVRPYFVVGLDPVLDPEGSDIPIRM